MIALGSWMIGCCLVAQAADNSGRPDLRNPRLVPKRTAPAARFDPPAGEADAAPPDEPERGRAPARGLGELDPALRDRRGLERVDQSPRKLRPPELLAEAIASPKDGRLKGLPLPLVDVLARATDRAAQKSAAVDYWRLAIAQAQYHWALDGRDRLRHWAENRHKVATLAQSQLAAAEAAVDDAELGVLKAGADLAARIGLPDAEQVPWAVDRPHVGAYDAKYEAIFAGKNAPGRLRLIHRTLPISRRTIDVHGEAVVSTLDALDATEEEYRQNAADYLTVAAWFDRLAAQRRAFLQSVLRYNEDIVEYAFTVAPQDADARLLAGTLIKSPSPPSRAPAAAQRERAVENPPPEQFEYPPADREGTPRTFRTDETPADETPADGPGFESGSRDSGPAKYRPVSAAADARAWRIVLTAGGLYQGLIGAKAAERAQRLAESLHWDRELPGDAGEKTRLESALARSSAGADRRALVAAYWRASEQVARYLVLADEGELLAALAQQAISLAAEPGGSVAMLRLQAARQAAQAAVLDAHIDVLTSEFELTRLAQMPLERAWIRPSTPPHGGVYNRAQTKASDRGKSSASAARVLMLHLELENLALAVVFADEYRAQLAAAGEQRSAGIDLAVSAVERQRHETERFLRALAQYNVAIADHVLAGLPPGAPPRQLVELLVPNEKRAGG